MDPLFEYYGRELQFLRRQGKKFAQRHPNVAARLDLNNQDTPDPHVERLMESFAFLTAKLQKNMDDQYPRFTQNLLSCLYPQFMTPVPSTAIACFQSSPNQGKVTTQTKIPRGTPLFARSKEGVTCHFKTAYDTFIQPVHITEARVVSRETLTQQASSRMLKITLESTGDDFKAMGFKKLFMHFTGDFAIRHALLEGLFATKGPILFWDALQENPKIHACDHHCLRHVGFEEHESLLPFPASVHEGYRLLMEYFYTPEKFFFASFDHENLALKTSKITLLFPLREKMVFPLGDIGPENIVLGCTPIINLFPKTTNPFRLTHKKASYRLLADARMEDYYDIHTILSVHAALDTAEGREDFIPFFSFNTQDKKRKRKIYWHAYRTSWDHKTSDVWLSFVDPDFNPSMPISKTIYAKTLCTNKNLPHGIPPGGLLYAEKECPASKIVVLDRPKKSFYPALDGQKQWALISHLSLNHLSILSEHGDPTQSLKDVVALYGALEDEGHRGEIEAIKTVRSSPIAQHLGFDAWRGYVMGTHIEVTFQKSRYQDTSSFLFGTLLNHFFALFTHMNSFTKVTLHHTDLKEIWKAWEPQVGSKPLL